MHAAEREHVSVCERVLFLFQFDRNRKEKQVCSRGTQKIKPVMKTKSYALTELLKWINSRAWHYIYGNVPKKYHQTKQHF